MRSQRHFEPNTFRLVQSLRFHPMTDADDLSLNSHEPRSKGGVEAIRAVLLHAPMVPGVYRMIDAKGEILYIGKARQLKMRLGQYAQLGQLPYKNLRMVNQVARVEYTTTHTEAEALLLEANLIKTHQPHYNILLKDDKSFPYILLTMDHDFPQIAKHRGPRKPGRNYFGPFASASAVNETIATLQKAFLIRPCADTIFNSRTRPCLQYQIKRCSAPCVNYVNKEEYGHLVDQAKGFLTGKSRELQNDLQTEMEDAAIRMEYERAGRLRDRLAALTKIVQQQGGAVQGVGDADVVAMVRAGATACLTVNFIRGGQHFGSRTYFPAHSAEREDADVMDAFLGQFYANRPAPGTILLSHLPSEPALLEEALTQSSHRKVNLLLPERGAKKAVMQKACEDAKHQLLRRQAEDSANATYLQGVAQLFELPTLPQRIEVYDNSHISGTHAVGAMIVAGPEGFMKKHYRTFNFPKEEVATPVTGGDDFAMMRQMLTRRLKRLREEGGKPGDGAWPDLLLIDGGLGQLNVALEVAQALDLTDMLTIVGIAKGPDRNAGREQFFLSGRRPFQLEPNDPVLHYLQRLRDESHRFAIGTHRNKRSKAIETSPLDAIGGIGGTRKKALLRHFGSARGVSNASLGELQQVPGISAQLAEVIYHHFHS